MKKNEIDNEKNIKNMETRRILRYVIIVLDFLTIIFAIANLFYQKTIFLILALVCLVIVVIAEHYRDKLEIIKNDELEDIKKEIEDIKNKHNITNQLKESNEKKNKNNKKGNNKKQNNKSK